jgi:ATP-dependent exoDNAse (exonuclease V) beta subunit
MFNSLQIEQAFKDIIFIEKNHSYKIGEKMAKCSVTSLLKKYTPEFKSDIMSAIVAKKRGLTKEDVLDEWDYKRDYSSHRGTELHKFAENYMARKQLSIDEESIKNFFIKKNSLSVLTDFKKYKNEMLQMISNFLKFQEWYKETYINIKSELVIGDPDTSICGTIDNLSYNIKTNKLAIFDYKTNQSIKSEGYKKETLLTPFNHLQNCEMVKYSLQLLIYKIILEKFIPVEVDELYIVWVVGDNYQLIKTMDLYKEAQEILKKEFNVFG